MNAFSFVHSADLHLDSPFVGLEGLPKSEQHVVDTLREATYQAFNQIVSLCLDRKADFLLVAGDVFDQQDRNLRPQLRFRDGLKRLHDAGIASYVVHGNHDPLDGWVHGIKMPELVTIFPPEVASEVFHKNGEPAARIHGISYPKKTVGKTFARKLSREGDEPFQIGLLHCHVGSDKQHEPYVPRTIEELRKTGLDYWAIGHIHTQQILCESQPFVGYPGNPQGRHINEPGERGCFLVHVDENGHPSVEFVATDVVRWHRVDVSIAELADLDDLLTHIAKRLESCVDEAEGRSVVARVRLTGRGQLYSFLCRRSHRDDLLQQLREEGTSRSPFFWVERLEVECRPEIDYQTLAESQDFLGDLLRLFSEYQASPARQLELKESLGSLYEHLKGQRYLDKLTDSEVLGMLQEAESRCVELFLRGDT